MKKFLLIIIRTIKLVWDVNPNRFCSMALYSLMLGIFPFLQIWIFQNLLDEMTKLLAHEKANTYKVMVLLGCQILGLAITQLINHVIFTNSAILSDRLREKISLQIIQKSNAQDLEFFEDDAKLNVLHNAFQEASSRPLNIVASIFGLFQSTITLGSLTLSLVKLSYLFLPVLILFSISIIPLQKKVSENNFLKIKARTSEARKQSYYGNILMSDWFIKEVRLFNLESYFTNLFKTIFNKFVAQNKLIALQQEKAKIHLTLISIVQSILGLFIILKKSLLNVYSIGEFTFYLQSFGLAQSQINNILNTIGELYSHSLYLSNLFYFLDEFPNSKNTNAIGITGISSASFEQVTFKYPSSTYNSLSNLTFSISKGQIVAIVGKNGAGKSTIVKLLCGFYKPSSGSILINGIQLDKMDLRNYRRFLSVLFQDFGTYYLSLQENIALGDIYREINNKEMDNAVKFVGAENIVNKLPKGYSTLLGKWFEDGVQLSGGEWLKIGLARAYYRDSQFLILDEPTAALDTKAEREFLERINLSKENRITIIISHKLSTIKAADIVLVLQEGRLVDCGTHDELLKHDGEFFNLYKTLI